MDWNSCDLHKCAQQWNRFIFNGVDDNSIYSIMNTEYKVSEIRLKSMVLIAVQLAQCTFKFFFVYLFFA